MWSGGGGYLRAGLLGSSWTGYVWRSDRPNRLATRWDRIKKNDSTDNDGMIGLLKILHC